MLLLVSFLMMVLLVKVGVPIIQAHLAKAEGMGGVDTAKKNDDEGAGERAKEYDMSEVEKTYMMVRKTCLNILYPF